MTIALAGRRRFDGPRFQIIGEISKNATWSQTLDFPAIDGVSASITGLVMYITFRELDDEAGTLTLSTTDGQLTVTDSDTLTISATADDLSGLTGDTLYRVDITSGTGPLHWASGKVSVTNNPAT